MQAGWQQQQREVLVVLFRLVLLGGPQQHLQLMAGGDGPIEGPVQG